MIVNNAQRIHIFIILFGAALVVGALTILISFEAYLNEEKGRLSDRVRSQARFMEVVARFNQKHSQDYQDRYKVASLAYQT